MRRFATPPNTSLALPAKGSQPPGRFLLELHAVDQHLTTRASQSRSMCAHSQINGLAIQQGDQAAWSLCLSIAAHRSAEARQKERPPEGLVPAAPNVPKYGPVSR